MRAARTLRRDERGIALVTSMILMVAMLGLGLALLAVVDVQSKETRTQREGDAAFNLADTALSSAAFVLSRNWPEGQTAGQPWTQGSSCGQQVIGGGVGATTDTTIAGQIQRLVNQASVARNGPSDATWSVKICDAGSEVTWSSALLARAAYDSTGRRTLTDPNGNQFMVRRMWVRAESTVNGEKRAVASLVQVTEKGAFPAGYGVVTGKMAFLNGVNATTDSLLTNGSALNQILSPLLSTSPMVTGQIGVRCGLLSDLCVDAVASTLTSIPLTESIGLTSGQVTQFGTSTTVSDETVRLLRERAVRNGTYFDSVAGGASCIPSGTTVNATSVVFVEKVGTGSQSCTLQAVPSRSIGTVIVGSGRVSVTSSSPTTINTLTGVLYALNKQADKQEAVVTVNKGAKIRGAVYVDGGGQVAVYPPDFSLTASMCNGFGLVQRLLCQTAAGLGLTQLLDFLLGALGVNGLVTALLPQLASYGPIVEYDAATVGTQTVYGSSGAVQGSFRQVPAGT